ncbi:hypothetical protein AMK26_33965 [Streptomyces sp. CB03234]|uniref:hypothetical protein n=1 Tax=Streptomyces sp. (strain CB03234) TaxID=1703937 RepID=UPI00093B7EE9|nr:hypothetical protein [Streptomyces sp. CB03234]OKJ93497.1 hypothetical protein AMK26_33965 [Streptomyces sp. CB03234]
MPTWGLLVEQNTGHGSQRRMWSAGVMGHVDGSREEAMAALRRRAETYQPVHPSRPRRRRLYRCDDGFLLVLEGAWQDFHSRFSLIELLSDSSAAALAPASGSEKPRDATPEPEPEPEPHPEPAPEPAPEPERPWDADVPEVPSWLGRRDLS